VSSSTSSSSGVTRPGFETERKVLLAVLLVLCAWEGVTRWWAPTLDYDRVHIHKFDALAQELKAAAGPRVLIYGNSLSLHGVDAPLIERQLRESGSSGASVSRFVPVGTDIVDWIYIYQTYFTEQKRVPDLVVLGFVAHHIPDNPVKRQRRLGRHFVSSQNMLQLFLEDLPRFDERFELMLAYGLASIGDQRLHQWEMYHKLIPHNREGYWRLYDLTQEARAKLARKRGTEQQKKTTRYKRLARLARLIRKSGSRGIFVAMPRPGGWKIDPQAVSVIEQHGMTFLDANQLKGIGEAQFRDGYHLNAEGKAIFSAFVARAVAAQLKRQK